MSNKSLMNELKEVCNLIVGSWHSEETGEQLIFDLNNKLLKESRLLFIDKNKKCTETVY